MSGILGIGASGLRAQQTRLDVIGNNIANAETPGFKASEAATQDDGYEPVTIEALDPQQQAVIGANFWLGRGVQVAGTPRSFTQGALTEGEGPLDLAIMGDGFFPLQMSDGTMAYSRDGRFSVDPNGHLVNASGYLLAGNIVVPSTAQQVTVDAQGNVTAQDGATGQPLRLGQIQLARFANPQGLAAIGDNLFQQTAASGAAQTGQPGAGGYGQVKSGALESSNVDLSQEFTRLMEAQRAYQASIRSIQTLDNMMGLANALQ